MTAKDLFQYEKYKVKFGKPSRRRFFKEASEEIIEETECEEEEEPTKGKQVITVVFRL